MKKLSFQFVMDMCILAGQPSSEEANLEEYREGALWGNGYKPGFIIGDKPLLEHTVDAYLATGFSVSVIGAPEIIKEKLGDKVQYIVTENYLGDKIRYFQHIPGMIGVSTADILVTESDARTLKELASKHEEKSIVMPLVTGASLLEKNLREENERMYSMVFGSTNTIVAAPQAWLLKPQELELGLIATLADTIYPNRNKGLIRKYGPILSTTAKHFFKKGKLGNLFSLVYDGWLMQRQVSLHRRNPEIPLASKESLKKIFSYVMKKPDPETFAVELGPWYSLAFDLDDEKEFAKVTALVEKNEW